MSQVSVSHSARFFEAQVSHPGAVRGHNEDAFVARGHEGFWMVADGMGGLADGQFASRTLVQALADAPLSGDLERDSATVAEVIRHAGFVIFKASTERRNHIGSTAVALLISGGRFAAIWAGDSRLYLRRGGALSQVTRDHTQVQQLVDAGYLSQADAADHPMSHVLARAVGVQAEVEVDTVVGEVQAGDLFLVCSDGLPRVVEDNEIDAELASGNPGDMVERLLEIALKREAPDNVTILAVGYGDFSAADRGGSYAPLLGGSAAADAVLEPPDAPEAAAPRRSGSTYAPHAATAAAASPAKASATKTPPAPSRSGGSIVGPLVAVLSVLLLVGFGIGAWLNFHRPPPGAKPQTLAIAPAVAQIDRHPFEAALGAVDCSWLQMEKVAGVPTALDLAISGVAASPPAVQAGLQAAATNAKVSVADIDLQSIAPTPPALCGVLDALRPFRAPTSITGQNLTAAQDSFALMKQADGKQAGRAIVDAALPSSGDVALVQLGADGSMSMLAVDRTTLNTLSNAATVVSKLSDTGGYRLQVDYGQKGWSSLMLLTGKGPFPKAMFTQGPGQRSAAWASSFATAARAGGWRVEMSWYEIVDGAQLSVIPQSQQTNAATNMIMIRPTAASNAVAAMKAQAANATKANAANLAVQSDANAAEGPAEVTKTPKTSTEVTKTPKGSKGQTNTAATNAPVF
jgi:serine/threonine-protein phosphatase Stp1